MSIYTRFIACCICIAVINTWRQTRSSHDHDHDHQHRLQRHVHHPYRRHCLCTVEVPSVPYNQTPHPLTPWPTLPPTPASITLPVSPPPLPPVPHLILLSYVHHHDLSSACKACSIMHALTPNLESQLHRARHPCEQISRRCTAPRAVRLRCAQNELLHGAQRTCWEVTGETV